MPYLTLVKAFKFSNGWRESSRLRRLASDSVFTGASQAVSVACQVMLQILSVRCMAPGTYGEYAAAFAAESVLEGIFVNRSTDVGLQHIGRAWTQHRWGLVKSHVRLLEKRDAWMNLAVWLSLAIVAIALPRLFQINMRMFVLIALCMPAQIGYGVSKSVFVTSGRIGTQSRFEVLFSITQLIIGSVGVYFCGVSGLCIGLVISAAIKTLRARSLAHRILKALPRDSTEMSDQGVSWFSTSAHSMLRNALAGLAAQVDLLMLNAYAGPVVVSQYKVAKSLSTVPTKLVGPIWVAMRPRLLRAYYESNIRMLRLYIVIPGITLCALSIVAAILLGSKSETVIARAYGDTYIGAAAPFVILAVGNCLFGAGTGWYPLWVTIRESKAAGSLIQVGILAGIVVFGFSVGLTSATAMATVVTLSLTLGGAACWLLFLAETRSRVI